MVPNELKQLYSYVLGVRELRLLISENKKDLDKIEFDSYLLPRYTGGLYYGFDYLIFNIYTHPVFIVLVVLFLVIYVLVFIVRLLFMPYGQYSGLFGQLFNHIVIIIAIALVIGMIYGLLFLFDKYCRNRFYNSTKYKDAVRERDEENAKLKQKAEAYKEVINCKEKEIDILLKKIEESDLLPAAYNNLNAIETICTYFTNQRVDNYKEAFNLYEHEQHLQRILNQQQSIIEAQEYADRCYMYDQQDAYNRQIAEEHQMEQLINAVKYKK